MGNCERLKWNRRKMKLSQSELAEKAGLSSATIGRLERDETRWEFITDETFDKLTRVFEEIQGFAFVKVHESNSYRRIRRNYQCGGGETQNGRNVG